ncbi:hypothetical protein [Microcoleus sp. N3A4]
MTNTDLQLESSPPRAWNQKQGWMNFCRCYVVFEPVDNCDRDADN